MRTAQKALAALVAFLLLGVGSPLLAKPASASSTPSFGLVQVYWGTSASKGSAGPGETDVPLTINLEYLSSPAATGLQAAFALPAGFTDYDGNSTASAFYSGSVTAGQFVQLTFLIDVGQYTRLGNYTFPLSLTWINTYSGEPVQEGQTFSPTVFLEGTASLAFSPVSGTLAPGQDDSFSLTVTNSGTGTARDVVATASLPSQTGTVVEQPPTVQSIGSGDSATLPLELYLESSSAGTTPSLSLAFSYLDPYNNSESGSSSLGLVVSTSSASASVLSFSTSIKSLAPGATNQVPLTVTNAGSTILRSVSITVSVSPSQDGSVLSQPNEVASLAPGASADLTASIYVPSGQGGAAVSLDFSSTYTNADNTTGTAASSLGLYLATATTAQLTVTPVSNSLVAGEEGDVSFRVVNTGTEAIFSPTFTLTATSPLVVVANSTLILQGATVNPGEGELFTALVGSQATAAGGIYSATLTVTYSNSDNVTSSATFSLGVTLTDPIAQVSVQSPSGQVPIGGSAGLVYEVTNTGNVPLYSPVFSLTVPSSLAVTANATFSKAGFTLMPGATFSYDVLVTSGPKTAEGAYVGTLGVQYADQFGNSHTLQDSVGLLVIGTVDLVIQDESVTQNGTSVSVSGSLLNEGTDSAYYLSVVANVTRGHSDLGSSSDYLGEVDPNSPDPFSLTFTFSPTSGAANSTYILAISAAFQNDFGQKLSFTALPYSLSSSVISTSGTRTSTGSSSGLNTGVIAIARLIVLAIIVVAVVVLVGFFAVRRRRTRKAKGGDDQVI